MTTTLPTRAGIGLRAEHYADVLERRPDVGWLEVHSENFFGAGGKPLYYLERARSHYPVSLHGVGMSLGSTDALNAEHLRKLKNLIARIEPALVSEHLSWGSIGGRHLNDLLPLPYTEEALDHFATRVRQVQDALGRKLLIENPSSYLRYAHSTIPEADFLVEVARRSGCGILLDVNNVYVSAVNHGFAARDYLAAIPRDLVREIHLAGHTHKQFDGVDLIIDSHDQPVAEAVWCLYAQATQLFPDVPVLIERDSNLPALEILVAEAMRAQQILAEQPHALVA